MTKRETIAVATRGSDLARRQAGAVRDRLADHRIEAELHEVETTGDRVTDALVQELGKTGAFVRALDERVLEGEVDAAVHSMKDLPTEQPEDLVVAAVPRRATATDVLLAPGGEDLEALPAGATVGTASLRRTAQVLARRPDLAVEPLRGNVDTRVEKLLAPSLQAEHQRRVEAEKEARSDRARARKDPDGDAGGDPTDGNDGNPTAGDDANGDSSGGDDADSTDERSVEEWFDDLAEIERRAMERTVETEYDAIVLAGAGLERTGLAGAVPTHELARHEHVPAAGQGALAVTARAGSDVAERLFEVLDHPHSRVATTAERIVLSELGGGCIAPVGVHAHIQGDVVSVRAQVLSQDGETEIAETRDLDVDDYAGAARDFAADLADRGAATLIEEASAE